MRGATLALIVWGLAALIWLVVEIVFAAGWRINHTASLPMGLWRVRAVDAPIRAGQIVEFCPPDTALFRTARERGYLGHGDCPGGYERLMKPVVAVGGDKVEVTASGIAVNGRLLANSTGLAKDGAGRDLPHVLPATVTVAEGELWLVSSHHPASFDSRYFGPIPAARVLHIAEPR